MKNGIMKNGNGTFRLGKNTMDNFVSNAKTPKTAPWRLFISNVILSCYYLLVAGKYISNLATKRIRVARGGRAVAGVGPPY